MLLVTVKPEELSPSVGGNAVFHCETLHHENPNISWIINEVPWESLNLGNVVVENNLLAFHNVSLSCNETTIRCNATFSDGRIEMSTNTATLYVARILQG